MLRSLFIDFNSYFASVEQQLTAAQTLQNHPVQRDRARLMSAMDALNRAHGKHTIYFANAHHTLDAAPMLIAFNGIPDMETRR